MTDRKHTEPASQGQTYSHFPLRWAAAPNRGQEVLGGGVAGEATGVGLKSDCPGLGRARPSGEGPLWLVCAVRLSVPSRLCFQAVEVFWV